MAVVTLFQSKREQFVGDDGIPLSNGRLYIGEPNEDPKVSALTVYSDRAKTSPIDQSSGIPLDAEGRPTVSVWIDQTYSYVVEDAAGNEVITEPYIEVVDVAALVQEEVDALAAALTTGYRNSNINGGMQVVREDVGSTVTLTSAFLEGKVAGSYGRATNVSAGTMEQGTDATLGVTGNHFLFNGVTLPGASDYIEFQDRFRSEDSLRYVNRSATASFLVRHDFGADTNFTITVAKADSPDDFSSVTTIGTSSNQVVASGVATVVEFTVDDMGDCSNGIAVTLKASAGAITTKDLAVTNAQLEQASERTPFEARMYREAKAVQLAEDYGNQIPGGYGQGCYFLGEYSFTGGAVDFVDICAGGDLDADLSLYDYIIIEGQFKVASAVATSVAAVEIGTVSGGIVNTDVYQYLAKYITPSSTTYAAIDQNTSVSKAANFYYRPGDTTAAYRFRIVVKKPIAGFAPAYVQISSKCIFIDAPTSNAGTQEMEGYVNGVSDFDWVRLYCTSGAVAGDASGVDISDGIFRAYGTNNPGFAFV